jgi:multidrug resistance efflux pump
MIKQISAFLLLSTGLVACGSSEKDAQVTSKSTKLEINQLIGIARVEPEGKIAPLGTEVPGVIEAILVSEGELVKKGQLLVQLSAQSEHAQVDQSQARKASRNERINSLIARIEALNIKLSAADVEQKRNRKLAESNAGTEKAALDAETAYSSLKAEVKVAQAELSEARTSLGELDAETRYLSSLKSKKMIVAPGDGMMLNWNVKTGQAIASGASLGDFAPAGDLIAITEIDELYALKVKNGQKVKITAQGSKGVLTTGKVIYCSPYLSKKSIFSDRADNLEDRRVREVRIKVDNPKAVLIGSRVECIIEL